MCFLFLSHHLPVQRWEGVAPAKVTQDPVKCPLPMAAKAVATVCKGRPVWVSFCCHSLSHSMEEDMIESADWSHKHTHTDLHILDQHEYCYYRRSKRSLNDLSLDSTALCLTIMISISRTIIRGWRIFDETLQSNRISVAKCLVKLTLHTFESACISKKANSRICLGECERSSCPGVSEDKNKELHVWTTCSNLGIYGQELHPQDE